MQPKTLVPTIKIIVSTINTSMINKFYINSILSIFKGAKVFVSFKLLTVDHSCDAQK